MTVEISTQIEAHDFVYALAESASALYAGRASGLYRSIDAGSSWQKVAILPGNPDAESLATFAVVADEQSVFVGVNGGVICSWDDGASWQFVPLASPPPQVVALALSPNFAADGFIAAGTAADGVFFSTDHGQSWVAWNFGLVDHRVYALAISPRFATDRTLFAGTESGLYRSKNGGRGWQELTFPTAAVPILSFAVSPIFAADNTLYAGTETQGLYISHNGGLHWEPSAGVVDGAVNMIGVTDQPSSQVWLVHDDQLVVSDDDGQTWQPYRTDGATNEAVSAVFAGSHHVIVGFQDGSMRVSQR